MSTVRLKQDFEFHRVGAGRESHRAGSVVSLPALVARDVVARGVGVRVEDERRVAEEARRGAAEKPRAKGPAAPEARAEAPPAQDAAQAPVQAPVQASVQAPVPPAPAAEPARPEPARADGRRPQSPPRSHSRQG